MTLLTDDARSGDDAGPTGHRSGVSADRAERAGLDDAHHHADHEPQTGQVTGAVAQADGSGAEERTQRRKR